MPLLFCSQIHDDTKRERCCFKLLRDNKNNEVRATIHRNSQCSCWPRSDRQQYSTTRAAWVMRQRHDSHPRPRTTLPQTWIMPWIQLKQEQQDGQTSCIDVDAHIPFHLEKRSAHSLITANPPLLLFLVFYLSTIISTRTWGGFWTNELAPQRHILMFGLMKWRARWRLCWPLFVWRQRPSGCSSNQSERLRTIVIEMCEMTEMVCTYSLSFAFISVLYARALTCTWVVVCFPTCGEYLSSYLMYAMDNNLGRLMSPTVPQTYAYSACVPASEIRTCEWLSLLVIHIRRHCLYYWFWFVLACCKHSKGDMRVRGWDLNSTSRDSPNECNQHHDPNHVVRTHTHTHTQGTHELQAITQTGIWTYEQAKDECVDMTLDAR